MLLDRYEIKDAALKVVGVGGVGTACWMMLFMAGEGDPLILQVKEARAFAGGAPLQGMERIDMNFDPKGR